MRASFGKALSVRAKSSAKGIGDVARSVNGIVGAEDRCLGELFWSLMNPKIDLV